MSAWHGSWLDVPLEPVSTPLCDTDRALRSSCERRLSATIIGAAWMSEVSMGSTVHHWEMTSTQATIRQDLGLCSKNPPSLLVQHYAQAAPRRLLATVPYSPIAFFFRTGLYHSKASSQRHSIPSYCSPLGAKPPPSGTRYNPGPARPRPGPPPRPRPRPNPGEPRPGVGIRGVGTRIGSGSKGSVRSSMVAAAPYRIMRSCA
jgi:hypothetical protein